MDISNYNKAEVFATLYNNARVQGMGFLQADNKVMTTEEAQEILDSLEDKYFDYFRGRVMKIDLTGNELNTRLYNRDNGVDQAENLIQTLQKV